VSIEELKKIILSSDNLTQEWYDLGTACKLKGVIMGIETYWTLP